MRHYHLTKNQYFRPVLNLDRIGSLIPADQAATFNKDNAPVIDTRKSGYGKVLGKGRLPSYPVIVKARFFSRRAEQKIKANGGACVLVA